MVSELRQLIASDVLSSRQSSSRINALMVTLRTPITAVTRAYFLQETCSTSRLDLGVCKVFLHKLFFLVQLSCTEQGAL